MTKEKVFPPVSDTYYVPSGGRIVEGRIYDASGALVDNVPPSDGLVTPEIALVAGLLVKGNRTDDGTLIEAVAIPWFTILEILRRDPKAAFQISPRRWEEIIAGAYSAAGFDEVILTPSSGDLGRDVIATKNGFGSIRIYDQVKAYKPGHLVTAEEVRAMNGILTGNVSKGVITTTSDFAPRIQEDRILKPLMPHRLELKSGVKLLAWLESVRSSSSNRGK
ncbi:MAG: restriction endonuclease [Denitromonas halophila]|nr:MAG: restriction endonuclease [Denitromonas halophila]TVT74922.1 MAG: restriction endonuclease [Denitromonas halophila]